MVSFVSSSSLMFELKIHFRFGVRLLPDALRGTMPSFDKPLDFHATIALVPPVDIVKLLEFDWNVK